MLQKCLYVFKHKHFILRWVHTQLWMQSAEEEAIKKKTLHGAVRWVSVQNPPGVCTLTWFHLSSSLRRPKGRMSDQLKHNPSPGVNIRKRCLSLKHPSLTKLRLTPRTVCAAHSHFSKSIITTACFQLPPNRRMWFSLPGHNENKSVTSTLYGRRVLRRTKTRLHRVSMSNSLSRILREKYLIACLSLTGDRLFAHLRL